MTPSEMAKAFLANIEACRAMMEDGQNGYVLHTADNMRFICRGKDGVMRLDHPQNDDVSVLTTHARAVTLQRYWNSTHKEDQNKVSIALRREAMIAYIDRQQRALDTLYALIDMAEKGATP